MQGTDTSFEYIPISHLNAYAMPIARAAFITNSRSAEMVVNEHVLEGQQLHERVDTTGSRARDEKLQLRRYIRLRSPLRAGWLL